MYVEEVVEPDAESTPDRLTRPPAGPFGRLRPWLDWFGPGRVALAIVTIVVVVIGGWWLLRAPAAPTEAGLPRATAASTVPTVAPIPPTTPPASGPILVHVAGAVANPGVYQLDGEARVHLAIDAAGGPRADADPSALNLAAAVSDGERIYVPVVGEVVPVASPAPGTSEPSGPVDLNQASAAQLDELPGIGPTTAAAIVSHREQHGPFATVEDLEAVRGIGPAKLDALRGLVST